MTGVSSDFDWNTDPDVIAHRQLPIAVYTNNSGSIVIRQERDWDEENDTFIIVAPATVGAFIAAVLKAAGREPLPALPSHAGDPTGAERQRRRRRKIKDAVTVTVNGRDITRDGVTARDGAVTAAFGQLHQPVGGVE